MHKNKTLDRLRRAKVGRLNANANEKFLLKISRNWNLSIYFIYAKYLFLLAGTIWHSLRNRFSRYLNIVTLSHFLLDMSFVFLSFLFISFLFYFLIWLIMVALTFSHNRRNCSDSSLFAVRWYEMFVESHRGPSTSSARLR